MRCFIMQCLEWKSDEEKRRKVHNWRALQLDMPMQPLMEETLSFCCCEGLKAGTRVKALVHRKICIRLTLIFWSSGLSGIRNEITKKRLLHSTQNEAALLLPTPFLFTRFMIKERHASVKEFYYQPLSNYTSRPSQHRRKKPAYGGWKLFIIRIMASMQVLLLNTATSKALRLPRKLGILLTCLMLLLSK